MEAQYGAYKYDKENGMGNYHINFCYRQADCLLTFELSRMMCEEAKKQINRVN